MSVATGIAPQHLYQLDADDWDELVRADAERWSVGDELVASLLELQHAALVAFLRVHSKRGARIPPPLEVPRPASVIAEPEPEPRRVSIRELAEMAGRTGD